MDIKPSDIADIQRLYKKHFDMELDYDTAYRKLTLLVRQVELTYRPITKEQVAKLRAIGEAVDEHKHVASSEK